MADYTALLPAIAEQAHLFEAVGDPTAAIGGEGELSADQTTLLDQLLALDAKYVGGLSTYRANAIGLLASSAAGENPLEGFVPSVPEGAVLSAHSEPFREAERRGIGASAHTGFVLVAGGLGERLGYGGIKVALPTESTSGVCCRGARARRRATAAATAAARSASCRWPSCCRATRTS